MTDDTDLTSILPELVESPEGNPQEVYWIDMEIPQDNGQFWATFSLPTGLANELVGPFGTYAYKMFDHTEDHAMYAYESFGEFFDNTLYPGIHQSAWAGVRKVKVPFIENTEQRDFPEFFAAKSLGNPKDLQDIIPSRMSFKGKDLNLVGVKLENQSRAHMRYEATFENSSFVVVLYYTIFARNPVVQVSGFVRAKDMKHHTGMLSITMHEEMMHLQTIGRLDLVQDSVQDDFSGDWTLTTSVILDTGAVFPFRFAILSVYDPKAILEPDEEQDVLDLYNKDSNRAVRQAGRVFRGLVVEWPGTWFGEEVIKHYNHGDPNQFLQTYHNGVTFAQKRRWSSEIGASQGGTQASFGPIFTVPIFSSPKAEILEYLDWNVEDWALRPVFVCEPGTSHSPIDLEKHPDVTTWGRQIHPASYDLLYDDFRPYGRSEIFGRSTHIDTHYADAPLQTAYALGADPVHKWIMTMHMHLDLLQRMVYAGWGGNGRAVGRVITGMVNNAICLPEYSDEVHAHILRKSQNLKGDWDGKNMPVENPVRVIDAITDGRLVCDQPAWGPWEEAQATYGFYRAFEIYGDSEFLDWAFILGRASNHAGWEEMQRWWKPYRLYADPEGKSLQDQLSVDSSLTHAGGAWIWWTLTADKVFLRVNSILDQATEEEVERANKIISWVRGQDPVDFVDAHMSLESRPTPPIR